VIRELSDVFGKALADIAAAKGNSLDYRLVLRELSKIAISSIMLGKAYKYWDIGKSRK